MTDEQTAARLWFAQSPDDPFVAVVRSPARAVVARVRQTSRGPVMLYETVEPEPDPNEQPAFRAMLDEEGFETPRVRQIAPGDNVTRFVALDEVLEEAEFRAWCGKSARMVRFTRGAVSAAVATRHATVAATYI